MSWSLPAARKAECPRAAPAARVRRTSSPTATPRTGLGARLAQNDIARHLRRICHAGQRHREIELFAQDFERLGDARLAVRAEAVKVRAADEAGARAHSQELENIDAGA